MAVSGITSATQYAGNSASERASNKLADDLDSFLFLLTTQLKNQDPLSPMDSTEFTNQLVQYANVEQNIATNSNLEKLIALQQSGMNANAVNYIGKSIQAETSYFPLQDGYSKFSYTLDRNVAACTVAITDISGKVIRTLSGDITAGTHILEWDGKDKDGNQLADGAYKLSITPIARSDQAGYPNVYTTAFGIVTGVASDEEGVYLGMGDVTVMMDQLLAVRNVVKNTTTAQDEINLGILNALEKISTKLSSETTETSDGTGSSETSTNEEAA